MSLQVEPNKENNKKHQKTSKHQKKTSKHQKTSKAKPKKLNCLAVDDQDPQGSEDGQLDIRDCTAQEEHISDVSPERLGGSKSKKFEGFWPGGVQVSLS